MANLKLVFDEEIDEAFSLIAIHCSEEEYKVAYLLNVNLGTRFVRREKDLDLSNEGILDRFPIYDFEDDHKYNSFHLVANRSRAVEPSYNSSSDLFDSGNFGRSNVQFLFPEFKKVDYFLKVYSDFETLPLRKILGEINQIKEVISAYEVDLETVKSKNNLIFD